MKKLITILLIVSILSLAGCMLIEEMYVPAEDTGTTQEAVDDVDESMSEIDDLNVENLEEELDLSELDNLEKELDEIDW